MAKKWVRALRNGSWEGHRRRAGSEFLVDAKASEKWFEDIGPADDSATDPALPPTAVAQAPAQKGFVQVMQELGTGKKPEATAPQTLSQAAVAQPPAVPGGDDLI